jgi:Holin of 3TMs, for gene-transfer release
MASFATQIGGKLASVFAGNIGDTVAKIVSLFKLSPEQAAEKQVELQKLSQELVEKQIDAAQTEMEAAKSVIIAEAQSQSWLPRVVRPLLLLIWGLTISVNYIVAIFAQFFPVHYVPVALPDWIYKLTAIGFTGYVTARTWEKVTDKDN